MTTLTRRRLLQAAAIGAAGVALPRASLLAQPGVGGIAIAADPRGAGYWVAHPGGVVAANGSAADIGGVTVATGEIVALAADPRGGGYWAVDGTGAVTPVGAAPALGGSPAPMAGRVVGIAARPGGDGYWLATSAAQVFAFGASPDLGRPRPYDSAIVGIASHPAQDGYWLLSRNGVVYAYGAAQHLGDPRLRGAVGIAANPSGDGYWVGHADGRVSAHGASAHHGDGAAGVPVVGIAAHHDGNGYWLLGADGTVAGFGSAHVGGGAPTDPGVPTDPAEPAVVRVGGILVATTLADPVGRLLAHAKADGYRLGGWGYRSYQQQVELRRRNCGTSHYAIYHKPSSQCRPPTARPGYSMHEKGLAIDFYRARRSGAKPIAGTAAFRWLKRHAATYGLYNLPSEPWHWSTNGR